MGLLTIDTPGSDLVLTLLVKDSGGLTSQDIVVINVEPGNRPPIAKIVTPSNGGSYSEGKEVTFDGTASSDPDNDILSYNWDLGEAGGPSYTASQDSRFSLDLDCWIARIARLMINLYTLMKLLFIFIE